MKCNVKKRDFAIIEKEDGQKVIALPGMVFRFIVDADKRELNDWSRKFYGNDIYNKENNTYVFDMQCCNFKRNAVEGKLLSRDSFYPILTYNEIIDFSILSGNEELDIIKYALEYLHDADLSEFGEENVKTLERVMSTLGMTYTTFN